MGNDLLPRGVPHLRFSEEEEKDARFDDAPGPGTAGRSALRPAVQLEEKDVER